MGARTGAEGPAIERTATEISALERLATRTARGQRGWAVWWRFVETWAGLAVAALSAVAGLAILSAEENQAPAAALALTSAVLGAVLGFTRPAEQAHKAATLALLCEGFERRARYARTLTLQELDADGARSLLAGLADRWDAIRWDDLQNQLDKQTPGRP
ncbi:hypothetical protein [Streptomyces sp. NPDC003952]